MVPVHQPYGIPKIKNVLLIPTFKDYPRVRWDVNVGDIGVKPYRLGSRTS